MVKHKQDHKIETPQNSNQNKIIGTEWGVYKKGHAY